MDVPERYVWLSLRVGRHIEDFIDAFVGPPSWQESVSGEPVDPKHLHDEALLLLEALGGADLQEDRRRWLRGQLRAVECITARLSGEDIAWTEEVQRCLGVCPTRTETEVIEAIHGRLDAVLAGSGSVRERYIAWDERNAVPPETLSPALERLNDVLRPRAHELARMPVEESVTYELVSDVPWIAFNRYQGSSHSRIEVNTDLPVSIVLLVAIAAHESYPGHHTERTAKDANLTRELGRVETSVQVAPTPESLVSEGVANLALEAALGTKPYEVVAEVLRDFDLRFDPAEAGLIQEAELELGYAVATNAAFMIHEERSPNDEVLDYIQTWGLESGEMAARTLRFVADPSARAYIPAYPEGLHLCRSFVERAPGNMTRLLTEQLTTVDLVP